MNVCITSLLCLRKQLLIPPYISAVGMGANRPFYNNIGNKQDTSPFAIISITCDTYAETSYILSSQFLTARIHLN